MVGMYIFIIDKVDRDTIPLQQVTKDCNEKEDDEN